STSPSPDLAEKARIYREYYSIERLRALVERPSWRREGFQDLWQGLRVTFQLFDENWRGQVLGLSPLDGDLFGSHTLVDLEGCGIDNHDLMLALRGLSLYEQKGQLRRVNYGALDVEELGSVYESLLEFHPYVSQVDGIWEFQLVTGSERKTTGSYYTPPELVGQLIKSALEPVIADRLRVAEEEFRKVGNRELGVGSRGAQDGILSGSSGLAGSDESGRDELSGDESISQGGNVRDDLTDSQGSSIGSSEHRRGLWSGESGGIHPVSTDSSGIVEGTGNPSASIGKGGVDDTSSVTDGSSTVRNRQQNAAIANSSYASQKVRNGESGVGSREIGNRELSPTSLSPDLPISRPISLQQLQESALLSLKVCDPACGSGHFLLAAARRIGKELARVRTGEMQPGAEPLRVAIRDVIQHCIYGVDLNPLAVDLCKVALWLEGLCRGLSLNFLDHRIKCGNSLVGVLDLDCLKEGIPDNAYKPVTGDDKNIASRNKKKNKNDLEDMQRGQLALELESTFEKDREEYAKAWREIEVMKDDDPAAVHQKQKQYERNRHLVSWLRDRSACNLWAAAFFMPLTEQNLQLLPTSGVLDNLLKGNWATQSIVDAANQLAEEKRFFHWPLEYPEVFEQGGFDCLIGNPPWEKIQVEERPFFITKSPEISKATGSKRKRLIERLQRENPELHRDFERYRKDIESIDKFIKLSLRFPLTGNGKMNTYSVFSELFLTVVSRNGVSGVIVPLGIATDDGNKQFFSRIVEDERLLSLWGFENEEFIFSEVHHAFKFVLLSVSGHNFNQEIAKFAFFCRKVGDIRELSRQYAMKA
ncbi:MAG: DNA methyltransferase, partial [Kovacikia sp.]